MKKTEGFRSGRFLYGLIAGLVIFGCRQPYSPVIVTSSALSSLTEADWIEDIDAFRENLPKKHINAFHATNETAFLDSIARFKADLPTLGYAARIVRFYRLAAAVGDCHTNATIETREAYPIALRYFTDGIRVVEAAADFASLLGLEVTAIGGLPISEVLTSIKGTIGQSNEYGFPGFCDMRLNEPLILEGLGFAPSNGVTLTLKRDDGTSFDSFVGKADPSASAPELLAFKRAAVPVPLSEQKDDIFWYAYLPSIRVFYLRYGACYMGNNAAGVHVLSFFESALDLIRRKPIDRLILDIRGNGGGNSIPGEFFDIQLAAMPHINRQGKIWVLADMGTFSSADYMAYQLKFKTDARFVGEPLPEPSNDYGEMISFRLPHCGLKINVSTKNSRPWDADMTTLLPDVSISTTFADWAARVDPGLEIALGKR